MSVNVTSERFQKALGIVWFRRDLRIADNPALSAAASTGAAVLPLYIDETMARSRYARRVAQHAGGAADHWWRSMNRYARSAPA